MINKDEILENLLNIHLSKIKQLSEDNLELEQLTQNSGAIASLTGSVLKILISLPDGLKEANMPDLTMLKKQKAAMLDFLDCQMNNEDGSAEHFLKQPPTDSLKEGKVSNIPTDI